MVSSLLCDTIFVLHWRKSRKTLANLTQDQYSVWRESRPGLGIPARVVFSQEAKRSQVPPQCLFAFAL